MSASNPKQFAKQICEYLKRLPDKYADDPQDVQDALGLSDADFKAGVDWCIARKLITLDKPMTGSASPVAAAAPKPASSSPFTVDEEDETVGDRKSVFASAIAKDDDDEEDETLGDREGVFGAGEPAGVG